MRSVVACVILASALVFAVASAENLPTVLLNAEYAVSYVTGPYSQNGGQSVIGLNFDTNGDLYTTNNWQHRLYRTVVGSTTPVQIMDFGTGSAAGAVFDRDGRLWVMRGGFIVRIGSHRTSPVVDRTVSVQGDLDMHIDPLSGDIFTSNSGVSAGIYRVHNQNAVNAVDVTVSNFCTAVACLRLDGFAFGSDGVLYTAAYHANPAPVYRITRTSSGAYSGYTVLATYSNGIPDGIATAPAPTGALPYVFVNRNDGRLDRIDQNNNNAVALVYQNGGRGDFATVGPNGCLYLTQSTQVIKVTQANGQCNWELPPSTQGCAGCSNSVLQGMCRGLAVPKPAYCNGV
eukprot:TRINITY_DN4880_c0_g1_i1.p1 TRINITY_DN4880_c0_g1~~TRINITY_DN4880_c0_g1_i1.p1  ORF type:complete len:344 (-),score=64.66 TRINITY_DN4880_c0_g1_i1:47-1078(-)